MDHIGLRINHSGMCSIIYCMWFSRYFKRKQRAGGLGPGSSNTTTLSFYLNRYIRLTILLPDDLIEGY
jgi:hypothetical protein